MNVFIFSRILLTIELASQIVVVVTESASNSQYKKFPPSSIMMGYSGQSLLVIIVAILLILMTLLVLKNLGRILVQTSWKISISCIGFSLASIAFRTFSSWFVVDSSSEYYIATYNITSYFIIIGAVLWVPFIFCKSDKYRPEPPTDAERYRIATTGGPRPILTHRPHQDEDNQSLINGMRESLPSYYEMIAPPAYKNMANTNNDASSPSTEINNGANDNIIMTENTTLPPPSIHSIDNRSPPPSINAPYHDNDIININNDSSSDYESNDPDLATSTANYPSNNNTSTASAA